MGSLSGSGHELRELRDLRRRGDSSKQAVTSMTGGLLTQLGGQRGTLAFSGRLYGTTVFRGTGLA